MTLLIALAVLALPGYATGAQWYVSNDGVEGAAATPSEPTTLHSALSRAGEGDTVYMRGGVYPLTSQIFVEKADLTLRNYRDERPTLVLPTDNRALSNVVWLCGPRAKLIGLEIVGGYTYGVKIEQPECEVTDCVIRNTGRDAVKIVRTASGTIISGCEISHTGVRDPSNAEGIDNVAADDVVVTGCYIHHTATNGLYMKGGAARCVIENNLVADTGHNGIMLGQSTGKRFMTSEYECRDSVARKNVVTRARGSGLVFEAASNCRFEENTLYDVAQAFGGGISVHANEHKTPSKGVFVSNNKVVVLSRRPMFFVHGNGLAAAEDMTSDGNQYFAPSGRYSFWYEPLSAYHGSLDDWRRKTPYDQNSTTGDPEFAMPPEIPPAHVND